MSGGGGIRRFHLRDQMGEAGIVVAEGCVFPPQGPDERDPMCAFRWLPIAGGSPVRIRPFAHVTERVKQAGAWSLVYLDPEPGRSSGELLEEPRAEP